VILCDANVLSEATKPSPDARVLAWLRAHEREVVIDAVILGELRFGILLLPRGRKRERLEAWFEAGARRLHCLPWDARTGLRWAGLLADLRKKGHSMPVKDSLIAATALTHGLRLATLDARDFARAGVELEEPRA
jgi:toxin FitB